MFGANANVSNENKPKDTPSTGFSFKLPASTTVTTITTNDSPASQTLNRTSTQITEAPKSNQENAAALIFGNAGGMTFADLAKDTNTNIIQPFSTLNAASFATLAQNSSNGSSTLGKSSLGGGFFGLSNKDTFNNLMSPQNGNGGQNSTTNNEGNENLNEDANYDPHYDPIIALPDEIHVSTGEENEEKLFGERAKLYRFDSDNKEVRIYL